ncbi:3'-phosphoadenosine 5'-phosphosulfate sulfotransferase (PAPS reductase)/FAD synthetase [Azospirillum oryzae]|uniref:3'-phosphoadenosine 5'-phosphosulfate sulfotransferase (PAPS reductase)/FAD synthetase n=1 Tax=Azospirillum oryzae TaxID=286727 RepID=A0A1X7F7H4_9PROT|nr:phosphoadenosine phosphosulfate reductase family protein [Azospirillum oryzae]SMF47316.1 3'-phosphoadenosine 5'-phosphosulfate sulfotransferase (PAPS reductase)/FAD synthetase [Azospirillum oryzae]
MSRAQPTLFEDMRTTLPEAIDLTVQSLQAYGPQHEHWAIAYSGGKDSTATLTLIMHLIETGRVPAPKSLTVCYADTRMELIPLAFAASRIMEQLRARGVDVRVAVAPMDLRMMVYMLGRGVPPPSNSFRWCTRQIKVEPMQAVLADKLHQLDMDGNEALFRALEAKARGAGNGWQAGRMIERISWQPSTVLMITGVRIGESAARDARIAVSCGKDGAECGQGWYQEVLPDAAGIRGRIATLAPILHWRVCQVWDWLMFEAPALGWATADVADAYGGDEAEEVNARTGCIGCPLASRDLALETVLRSPRWSYLRPLADLKPLVYRELRKPKWRLRKTGMDETGNIAAGKNKQRMGPVTLDGRRMALERVLDIQRRCNDAAAGLGRPTVDLLNAEEETRIRELIAAETWPQGWDGDEPTGDVPLDLVYRDGLVQPLLVR